MSIVAKEWILQKPFDGFPKAEDIKLVESQLPELKEGEILCEGVYWSVDPYMLPYTKTMTPPFRMIGQQYAKVTKTRNGKFPLGTHLLANLGWVSAFISDGSNVEPIRFDLGATPASYTLGTLGMPGATAHFGLHHLMQPKAGETIIVNGAAGAVGSVVGQLAKIAGCKVIAFAGSDEKVKWLKDDLKFDHVFNYKTCKFSEEISKVAPEGVEMFFDNVGGEWFHTILNKHLKKYARATICGSIETYSDKVAKLYPAVNFSIVGKELKIQGIHISTYHADWPVAFTEMNKYIQEGKLKVNETFTDGFENMAEGWFSMLKGGNIGKALIRA